MLIMRPPRAHLPGRTSCRPSIRTTARSGTSAAARASSGPADPHEAGRLRLPARMHATGPPAKPHAPYRGQLFMPNLPDVRVEPGSAKPDPPVEEAEVPTVRPRPRSIRSGTAAERRHRRPSGHIDRPGHLERDHPHTDEERSLEDQEHAQRDASAHISGERLRIA